LRRSARSPPSDIVYHVLVVLAMHDMSIEDLRAELAERRS
jgi:phosphoribosyl-ATP pyrophosphohydrolase